MSRRAVSVRQTTLFLNRNSGKTVVRRVADDDEDRRLLFDVRGSVAFLFERVEGERQLLLRLARRLPTRERVRQIDADALALRKRTAFRLQQQTQLQVRDDERRGQYLEAEHAPQRSTPEIAGPERLPAPPPNP